MNRCENVVATERHVAEDVVGVRKKVIIGEDVLLMGIRDEELVSSRACALPKNLIASLPYRIARDESLEAYCIVHTNKTGWGRPCKKHKALKPGGGHEGTGICVVCSGEDRRLSYSHSGTRTCSNGRKNKKPRDEQN
jgi:hypothetical protein